MILQKYIFKDIVRVQFVCFIVLFTVFLCQTVIKLLSRAASGSIPVKVVSELVLYSMPSVAYILLPMTLYVGIIVSLSRMSSDSEMVVMKSVGLSGFSFMKICSLVALISATLTAINSLYLLPHATYEQKLLSQTSKSNPNYLPIESGKFSNFGDYTIYIQKVDTEDVSKHLERVFVVKNIYSLSIKGKISEFISANKGYLKIDPQERQWLVLEKGSIYRNDPKTGSLETSQFRLIEIPIPSEKKRKLEESNFQSMMTSDLLKSDNVKAKIELQWRIAPIFACFIFAFIAVPLSMINPRQGRFARLGPAILLFVCYYLALLSFRNLLNSGKLSLYPGMYLVPLLFIVLVAIPLNLESPKIKFKKRRLNKQNKKGN